MTAIENVPVKTSVPGLYALALPIPFPLGTVNVYLAEGDPLTLIDCGTALDDSYDVLCSGLASLGHQPGDVRRLVITHHHTDHAGGAGRLAADAQAAGSELTILAHPRTAPHIETPALARADFTGRAFEFFRRQGGVPEDVLAVMNRMEDFFLSLVSPAHVTATIDEGDSLQLVGQTWRVLHMPGHAGDQLCFFQPESRLALASDHLLADSKSNPLFEPPTQPSADRPRRLIEYECELLRFAALDPAIAYTGHGKPVTDVQVLVAERIERRKVRTEKLFDLLAATEPENRTLYELTKRLFPRTSSEDSYLTLSETLGHLDFLEQQGRVTPIPPADGTILWEKGHNF